METGDKTAIDCKIVRQFRYDPIDSEHTYGQWRIWGVGDGWIALPLEISVRVNTLYLPYIGVAHTDYASKTNEK